MLKFYLGTVIRFLMALSLLHSTNALASDLEHFLSQQSIRAKMEDTYGEQAIKRIDALISTLQDANSLTEKQKLTEVNNFFNQFVYKP